jgi:hypothetical protein
MEKEVNEEQAALSASTSVVNRLLFLPNLSCHTGLSALKVPELGRTV